MDWFRGKNTGIYPYLMVKSMVSCKIFPNKPIDSDQTELPDIFWDYRDKCAAQIPSKRTRNENLLNQVPSGKLTVGP